MYPPALDVCGSIAVTAPTDHSAAASHGDPFRRGAGPHASGRWPPPPLHSPRLPRRPSAWTAVPCSPQLRGHSGGERPGRRRPLSSAVGLASAQRGIRSGSDGGGRSAGRRLKKRRQHVNASTPSAGRSARRRALAVACSRSAAGVSHADRRRCAHPRGSAGRRRPATPRGRAGSRGAGCKDCELTARPGPRAEGRRQERPLALRDTSLWPRLPSDRRLLGRRWWACAK